MNNPIRDLATGFIGGWRRAITRAHAKALAEVSSGKVATADGSTPLAEIEANRAEAEADLMHASRHLQALLVARADPELTEAIGRWSLGLSRVVDLSAAVNRAKEGATK